MVPKCYSHSDAVQENIDLMVEVVKISYFTFSSRETKGSGETQNDLKTLDSALLMTF